MATASSTAVLTSRSAERVAAESRRRGRAGRVAIAFALALGLAELTVRLAASHLPAPQLWSSQEAQAKVVQMHQLAKSGGVGGIVFVGSSMMDAALDADVYRKEIGGTVPVYNAALRSSLEPQMAAWTTHVVLPVLHPRVVIIGVSSSDLTPNDVVRNGQATQFFDAPGARQALGTESWLQQVDRTAGSLSALVRYRNVLRKPSAWGKHPQLLDGSEKLGLLGTDVSLRHRTYYDPPWVQDALRNDVLKNFTVGQPALDALRQLVSECRRRGIAVLIVDMPLTADFVSFHPHGSADYQASSAALKSVATQTGSTYVGFGVWPTELFGDPIHLNGAGSERFTSLMASPAKRG